MKGLFFGLLLIQTLFTVQAQRLHFTTFAGISNYQGDLQDKKFTFDQSHFAFGIGGAYEITDQLLLTGSIKSGKISADDKKSTINADRNLNFTSPVTEISAGLEYDIFNLNERGLTPYLFAGIAAYHFNPYTYDSVNNKVFLRPLGTEGEGFYQGRKIYSNKQISIPLGGGIKMALTDNVRLGFEIGFRKTFTDYLDDVSTTYVNADLLRASNGQLAVDLAFRGDELKAGTPYPADNARRGNPKSKDWYYFSGVTLSFRLGSGDGGRGTANKSKTGCPVNVY